MPTRRRNALVRSCERREQAEQRRIRRVQHQHYRRDIDTSRAAGYRFLLVAEPTGSVTAHRIARRCLTDAINSAATGAATLSPAHKLMARWRCPRCIQRLAREDAA